MKKRMAFLIIFVFSISLGWAQKPKPSITKSYHTWNLTITPQTKKHYLDSVSAAWKKDSIDLKFSKLQYDDKGRLMIVSGSVNFMSKNKPLGGTFIQDSVFLRPIQIKLTDKPGTISQAISICS